MASQKMKEIFSKNLTYQLEKSGLSQRQASILLGIRPQTMSEWILCHNYPRPETIYRIAEVFGCRAMDLTEERISKHQRMEDSLVLVFNKLKPEGQLKLLAFGQELLKQYKRED